MMVARLCGNGLGRHTDRRSEGVDTMGEDEITIVDGDSGWVEAVVQKLTEEGYRVCIATRGEDASNMLSRHTVPALVVLDADLRDFSGLHLLAEFRRRNVVTPVLIISGNDRASIRGEALSSGANGFLQKPVTPSLLVAAVHRVLGNLAVVHGS
jgi:DNA-binding response OmpR family regulator